MPASVEPATSPMTLAWHAVQEWEEKLKRSREALNLAWQSARPAWIALADECHRLGAVVDRVAPALEQADQGEALGALELMLGRLRRRLTEAGVECLCPVGEAYTPELSDFFENVAQKPCPETNEPMIVEVIEPAILLRGSLIRPGKAIVGVPTED